MLQRACPNVAENRHFFSDLSIEIYGDDLGAISLFNASTEKKVERKQPIATVKAHKMVVSWHSRYLFKMLTSGLREGSENTIRLTTNYPESLRKLLLSFYEHELEIGSAEELVELLYLADEYDVPNVMEALKQLFYISYDSSATHLGVRKLKFSENLASITSVNNAADGVNNPQPFRLEITLENAPLFLSCSGKIGLNLEPMIFAGLAQKWWLFGPTASDPSKPLNENSNVYDSHKRNCNILLQSLNYSEF